MADLGGLKMSPPPLPDVLSMGSCFEYPKQQNVQAPVCRWPVTGVPGVLKFEALTLQYVITHLPRIVANLVFITLGRLLWTAVQYCNFISSLFLFVPFFSIAAFFFLKKNTYSVGNQLSVVESRAWVKVHASGIYMNLYTMYFTSSHLSCFISNCWFND